VAGEELVVERVEDSDQHLLGGGEVEPGVVAHEFAGVRELPAVEAGGEEPVGVAGDRGEGA
jgi:hypothetical protein